MRKVCFAALVLSVILMAFSAVMAEKKQHFQERHQSLRWA
jgi:hypothetical protein